VKIVTGIDIVSIEEFADAISKGGTSFLSRCFVESELSDTSPNHLAGIFAAKEAVIKALDRKAGSWAEIKITKSSSGKPQATVVGTSANIRSHDVSISHAGGVAIAQYTALLDD